MKREYNEVYGFMPDEIINHLSQADKMKMFVNWLMREPTKTGWTIVNAVVEKLGEKFIEYIFDSVIQSMEYSEEEITRESLIEEVKSVMEVCATDINILYTYVENFQEQEEETPVEKPGKKTPERDSRGRFVKKQ